MTKRAESSDGQIHEFPDTTPQEVIDRVMKQYAADNTDTRMKTEIATEGLQNITPTLGDYGETAVGMVEGGINMIGKVGSAIGAGIAGTVDALRPNNFIMPDPEAKGNTMRIEGDPNNPYQRMDRATNTIDTMMGEAGEAFQPITEGGERVQEAAGKGMEAVGKGIKYPLSAVPFIAAENLEGGNTGTQEREKFMEMPMSKYLGELAEDLGASPLLATIAHMVPTATELAIGTKLAGGATKGVKAPTRQPAPTVEALMAESRALYQAVDDAGIRISGEAFEASVGKLLDDFYKAGGRQSLTPRTYSALQELRAEAAQGGITLAKAEELRRVLGKARSGIEAADRASANAAIHAFDDFIESLKPTQLRQSISDANISGVVGIEGIEYVNSARSLWGRARKTETMEEMIETAGTNAGTYSGAGFENALRIQFKQLDRKIIKDSRVRNMYTPAERAAIRKVAIGTPVGNVLRAVGKWAPSGLVSGAAGASAGFYIFGPYGAVAVPAIGTLGRMAATKMSLGNANAARELMARGQ